MTLDELVTEAEAMMKPCFHLGFEPTAGGIAGYWNGDRSDFPNELPPEVSAYSSNRHIITVSESLFIELDLMHHGPAGLFELEFADNRGWQHRVNHESRLRFSDIVCTGLPLYATAAQSLPPFQALCLYGSERVESWLRSLGLLRHEYWKVVSDVVDEYEFIFQQRTEFYNADSDVVAIVGGWHMMWPDDDFYFPLEVRLLFLTLRDAEPWFEVWHVPMTRGCFAKERIT